MLKFNIMANSTSLIQGYFTKIMWTSKDSAVVIAIFKITKNDAVNEAKVNKFNSISVTLKNNIFNDKKITLETNLYQIEVSLNKFSKYPNSYILESIDEIIDDENYKKNYIVKFLKSTHFRGIGEEKAWAIVNDLGINALSEIVNRNDIDFKKYKLSETTWNETRKYLLENPQIVEDQILFLELNLSPSLYQIILKKNGTFSEFLAQYQTNFYLFYLDNQDIKLEDVDKLHLHFNKVTHPFAIATHIFRALNAYFFDSGNTRIEEKIIYETLIESSNQDIVLPRNLETFINSINLLIESGHFIKMEYVDGTYLTTKNIYEMETYIIERLKLIQNGQNAFKIDFTPKSKYHNLQLEAISAALNEKLVFITGSPGTGKTLITNEIINNLLSKYDSDDLAIVTPTGRATININSQQNEIKAITIHSFLEWDIDNNRFNVNERFPKSVECLIIDEFSMVSLDLFYSLLKGINKKYLKRIVLVGDKDQLPAIGPGYLINDFIENNIFKTIFLTKIYRQSENFDIITDALDINAGKMPKFAGKNSHFINVKRTDLKETLIEKIEDLIESGYSKKDIAVLSPIYNYASGIDEINAALNTYFRSKEETETIKYRERTFAIDDKIINLTNDPKIKVFNGEIGYISQFTTEQKKNSLDKTLTHIHVDFENGEKSVCYSRSDFLVNTYPAYCTSVHKYQGSECKVVIVLLFSEAKRLLSKKLIYTAITRAKQFSVILGEEDALITGIKNDNDSNRITNISKLWNEANK